MQPAALAELTRSAEQPADGQNLKRSKMGGVRTAAGNYQPDENQQEEAAHHRIREFDGDCEKIIDDMFLFENLVEVDVIAASSAC
ncbi:hypothetical protein ACNKHQ_11465 [Shigella flexneri]